MVSDIFMARYNESSEDSTGGQENPIPILWCCTVPNPFPTSTVCRHLRACCRRLSRIGFLEGCSEGFVLHKLRVGPPFPRLLLRLNCSCGCAAVTLLLPVCYTESSHTLCTLQ